MEPPGGWSHDLDSQTASVAAAASRGLSVTLAWRREARMIEPRPSFALLLAAAAILAAPAWAAGLNAAQVRAFVAEQERTWNAGALGAYFAAFQPDAVFTDQYRTPAGQIVPYGSSTLAEARAQSRKFRAASKLSEKNEIVRMALGPDGRTAQVDSRVVSRI